MGDHVPSRRLQGDKRHKRGFHEDVKSQRSQRVSFKKYIQELEEELLEQEFEDDLADDDE